MKIKLTASCIIVISFISGAMEPPISPDIVLKGLNREPIAHKFSPQADKVLIHSGHEANSLYIYETATGTCLATIAAKIQGFKWSPQGSFVAVKTRDKEDTGGQLKDTWHIYTNTGALVTEFGMDCFSKMKFSNDEKQIYYWPHPDSLTEEDAQVTVVDPYTGKIVAQLSDQKVKQNKLVAIDPLDKLIAVVSGKKTNFFSRDTFATSAELPLRITCYSPDGSLIGAYNWTELGGQHSVFNRVFQCVAVIAPSLSYGCYATINGANTILAAYSYYGPETSFSLTNPESMPVYLHNSMMTTLRSFSSWDGTRRITLKQEAVSKEAPDLFCGYNDFTRVFVTDIADETLDTDKSILLPGTICRILYTHDQDVVVMGRRHIVNLKTCQAISSKYGTQKEVESIRRRKVKQLISKTGAYLDVINKNGDESVCIRKLDWNKKP